MNKLESTRKIIACPLGKKEIFTGKKRKILVCHADNDRLQSCHQRINIKRTCPYQDFWDNAIED